MQWPLMQWPLMQWPLMQQKRGWNQADARMVGHGPWTLELGQRLGPKMCELASVISDQDPRAARIHLLPGKGLRATKER